MRMMMSYGTILAVAVATCATLPASAETYTWMCKTAQGSYDNGDWETPTNWRLGDESVPGTYPGSGDVIVMPSETETGRDVKQVRLTASGDGRTIGTVRGDRGYEIMIYTPRNSSQNVERTVKIENPNDFAGAWRPDKPRTILLFENDSSFTPRLATLETQARAYVNVTNENARVKVGLLKAKNDCVSYNSSGSTRYCGGGVVVKQGRGTLEIEEAAGLDEKVYIDNGALAIDGKPKATAPLDSILSRAWLRLDASQTNSMSTYLGADGRTYVTNWPDANGSARAARRDKSSNWPTHSADYITQANDPFFSPVRSETGLPLMDFGASTAGDA